ncbi:hypothetical protein TNCV_3464941 [Trichonephila clavipes]|nr:hypothetical protein TNCV_3464941 [Trichonephila clavipes]
MFRDRVRTSINVLGDAFGAGIMHDLCSEELEQTNINRISIEIRECNADSQRSSVSSAECSFRNMAEHKKTSNFNRTTPVAIDKDSNNET